MSTGERKEGMNFRVFPQENFMSRDNDVKTSEVQIKENLFSWAAHPFFACIHNVFPCVESKKVLHHEDSTSNSTVSDDWKTPTTDGSTGKAKAIIFTMGELNKATSRFSSSWEIGRGGFGTVYKGKLRDGTIVAIKRAKKDKHDEHMTSQFQSEVHMLAAVEHLNLVRLIGYLEDRNERILVEEYVSNGNLRQHLDGQFNAPLDLLQRLDIAIDVAHALTYLHLYADRPIIHRDVKSSNILLTESFRAKVADFGFSRNGPMESDGTHVSTNVKGTAGYLDPEYLRTYKLTSKSDVYAFGILLVELITGRRPIEGDRDVDERVTVRWAYKNYLNRTAMHILDPVLEKTDTNCHIMEKMFDLAFSCSAPTKADRPTMKEATESLWSIRKNYQDLSQSNHQSQH